MRKTTTCDFYKNKKTRLFKPETTTCEITGTNIPDEHQCEFCKKNFFKCPFFEEWRETTIKFVKEKC